MNKLTDDLNVIQNLANQPTENAKELKAKFDEAGNIIKDFINDVVEPAVTKIEGDYLSAKDLADYKKELEDTLESFQESINEIDSKIQKSMETTTNSSDFISETKAIAYSVTQSQTKGLTATYSKEGYKPVGIGGYYYSNLYEGWTQGCYASSITDTSITVQGFIARGNVGGTTAGTLYINIIWVKVKETV